MLTSKSLQGLCVLGLFLHGAAASAYRVEQNVLYDTVGGIELRLDAYLPSAPAAAARPALVFIHGGCFIGGGKADIPDDVRNMADAGLTVFSLDYRKAVQAKYPGAVTDVQQAIRFIRGNAARFGIDPERIAVHGVSAGGYLAAVLGVRPLPDRRGSVDAHSAPVQLVVDWYGRTDFTYVQKTGYDCAAAFLGMARTGTNRRRFEEASILPYVDGRSARFLIMHGTRDEQVHPYHSAMLANRLWDAGRSADLYFIEGSAHEFLGDTAWKLARNHILGFFGLNTLAKTAVAGDAVRYSVNAGSPTGSYLAQFGADRFMESGFPFRYATTATTEDTSFPDLYMDVRAGNVFSYNLPLKAGVYRFGLFFAEKNPDINAVGQRVFDVSLKLPDAANPSVEEEIPLLQDLDILKRVGKHRVMRRYVHLISRTGKAKLHFRGQKGANAIISSFEVTPVPF